MARIWAEGRLLRGGGAGRRQTQAQQAMEVWTKNAARKHGVSRRNRGTRARAPPGPGQRAPEGRLV